MEIAVMTGTRIAIISPEVRRRASKGSVVPEESSTASLLAHLEAAAHRGPAMIGDILVTTTPTSTPPWSGRVARMVLLTTAGLIVLALWMGWPAKSKSKSKSGSSLDWAQNSCRSASTVPL